MRLLAALLVSLPMMAHAASPAVGHWLGRIDVGGMQLRIGFTVSENPNGSLSGTMTSLDQSPQALPADQVSFVPPLLRIDLAKLHVHFEGKVSGDELAGTFTQGQAFPLSMKRVAAFADRKRPQLPKRPFPYREENVSVVVPSAYAPTRATVLYKLTGTLTIPTGKGPFPAVLLITGSGPEDRDETLFDHKPFLVLADALTRAGIATLRFDDRGTGTSEGSLRDLTTTDLSRDAQTELELLVHRPEIDAQRVGLIGHSEGGLIAPMLAARSPMPRYLVLLAGPGVNGRKIIDTQEEAILRASGADAATIARAVGRNDKLLALVASEPDPKKLEAKVRAALANDEAALQAALPQIMQGNRWLHEFLTLDPTTFLTKVKIPVLALNGERDLQVDAATNLPAIDKALRAGGDSEVTIVKMPTLNHLFQHAKTGLPTEYGDIEETFAPEAIDTISAFILAR